MINEVISFIKERKVLIMNSIYHRISIRKYEDRPVEPEKIQEILRAGMQAPSAGDQQPWEFYVVTNRETLAALGSRDVSPYAGMTASAPAAIVIAKRIDCDMPEYADIDCSICTENMWLMCDSLGLGGVMLGIAPLEDRMRKVEKILNMPENLQAFAIFPFGYPAEDRPQRNRFKEDRIHYVK